METTENNDKFQKLNQEKQSLEKKLRKMDNWVYPLSFIITIMVFNLSDIMGEVTANRIFVVLIIISLPFFGHFVVKDVKLRWRIDDIERKIKRIEKLC